MDLRKVSIGIKTFLRDEKLFNTVEAIGKTMPEVTMVIADCGESSPFKNRLYADMMSLGDRIISMPFDSGFGAMSNAIAAAVSTPYLLIGSDDFDFSPPSVREGIAHLVRILDHHPVDIASGRVRGPYEFDLEDRGDTVIEHVHHTSPFPSPLYSPCDLTVNYSLIRREVFEKVRWDDDVKIGGGEHGAFFVDVKRAGYRVAYVPGVEIGEQVGEDSERYKEFRRRASSPRRPCFDRRGISKYILGNGKVDYERLDYPEPITR